MPTLDTIKQNVVVVDLTIRWPRLRRHMRDAVVNVSAGNETVPVRDDFCTDPQWHLMPERWSKTFRTDEYLARKVLHRHAISHSKLSLLPATRADDVFRQLEEIRHDFLAHRDSFVAAYPDILHNIRQRLQRISIIVADELIEKLPSADAIANKFDFATMVVPINGNNLGPEHRAVLRDAYRALAAAGDNDRAERLRLVLDDIDAGPLTQNPHLAEALRERVARFADTLVEQIIAEPRQRLHEATANLLESLRRRRVVKQGTLRQVAEAVELLRGFSFVQDEDIMRQVSRLDQMLSNADIAALNAEDRAAANALAQAVEPVVNIANDAATTHAVRRRLRRIG